MTLGLVLASAADLGLGDLERSMALRDPPDGALELLADVGADAGAEHVELVLLLDAVVEERRASSCGPRRAGGAGSSRRAAREQVADADVELERLDVGVALGRGAAWRRPDEERADEAVTEVGQREPLRRRRRPRRSPGAATTKSTSVSVGAPPVDRERRDPRARRSIEKAKKRSPTMSQRAWKLPIPSPMRSNQPSVRTASSENSFRASLMCSYYLPPNRRHRNHFHAEPPHVAPRRGPEKRLEGSGGAFAPPLVSAFLPPSNASSSLLQKRVDE